jgi:hypothetical protein
VFQIDVKLSPGGTASLSASTSASCIAIRPSPNRVLDHVSGPNDDLVVLPPLDRYGSTGSATTAHPTPSVRKSCWTTTDAANPMIDAASGTCGARLVSPNPDRPVPAGNRSSAEWHDEKPMPK